jgi:hydroxymethylpyrimidine pyrophosphatase-like HAD family hydrolase
MARKKYKIFCVDFDGTVVDKRKFPTHGPDIPHCVEVMLGLVEKGHKIILNTMRSGPALDAAIKWFEERNIPLYSVNTCPGQKHWTKSPKCDGDVYIDDKNFGIKMIQTEEMENPGVDWLPIKEKYL